MLKYIAVNTYNGIATSNKNELKVHDTTPRNIAIIIISKRSQMQKSMSCMIPLTRKVQNRQNSYIALKVK